MQIASYGDAQLELGGLTGRLAPEYPAITIVTPLEHN